MDDSQPVIGDDNKFSMLEDTKKDDDCSVDAEASVDEVFQELKTKISDAVENLSMKDADDIINQCNDTCPEAHVSEGERNARIASLGVHEHVSRLEK